MTQSTPPLAYDWPALAGEAQAAVQRREQAFPKLVEHLGQDAAESELSTWRAIAAEWRWATTHSETPEAPKAGHYERIAMLERSLARCERDLRREHGLLPHDVRQLLRTTTLDIMERVYGDQFAPFLDAHLRRDRVAALLWWQRRTGPDSLRFLVETTIELRTRLRGNEIRRAA